MTTFQETCCWPQRTTYPRGQTPCTLRPGKICSPTQGPCCDPGCSFKSGDKCRDNNGCRDESFCDGTAAQCPMSVLKPNKTVCNKEFVCYKGVNIIRVRTLYFRSRMSLIVRFWQEMHRVFNVKIDRNWKRTFLYSNHAMKSLP